MDLLWILGLRFTVSCVIKKRLIYNSTDENIAVFGGLTHTLGLAITLLNCQKIW